MERASSCRLRHSDVATAQGNHAAVSPRVLIQQDCIPHYRVPVFKQLSACADLQVKFVSDPGLVIPFLRVVDGADHGLPYFGAKTYLVRLLRRYILTWQPAAIRLFLRERPDVLIAQGAFNNLTTWVLCVLGRYYGIPVLLWGHGILKDEHGPRWWLRKTFYRLATGHLLYGRYAHGLLIKKGFDPAILHVVYNSLDYDLQRQVMDEIRSDDTATFREGLGIEPGQGMVVFTGRLQAVKRLDMLLHAIAILARGGKCVHVALVGEGSESAALTALSQQLDIARQVHFLGAIYDERQLGLIIDAADLAVVPSGAGLSVMHALTFGTPVLMHDRVEYHFPEREAVEDGVTGFYYRYNDVDDLANKMAVALFPQPRKPDMSACCKAVINERYNPHRQVETIVSAVCGVLESKRLHER